MPKQSFSISRYEGGLNNESDIRDIEPNEFSVLKNVNVDHIGRLEIIGGVKSVSEITVGSITGINPGYGIFTFGMDESFGSGGKKFIAIAGTEASTGDFICKIYEDDGTDIPVSGVPTQKLLVNDVSVTKDTGAFEPVFTYINGGLRVTDGNLDNDGNQSGGDGIGSTTQWFGYIKNDITFYDSTIDGFYVDNMPVSPIHSSSDDINTCDFDSTNIQPGADIAEGRVIVALIAFGTNGTWEGKTYSVGISYEYCDGYETMITVLNESWSTSNTNEVRASVAVNPPLVSPRILKIKIYLKELDSDDWLFLAYADIRTRIAAYDDATYASWSQSSYNYDVTYSASFPVNECIISNPPTVDTYLSNTGKEPFVNNTTETIVDEIIKYKTSIVANNIRYVANLNYTYNERTLQVLGKATYFLDRYTEKFEDSVFKSFVGMFDAFDKKRRLDVVISDGESIVKLEEYADRLLEYKEETLYIINVSQEIEFLESVHKFRGVTKPYHVYRTEFGIIWANKYGIYLYDGQTIHELLKRQNIRKISMTEWQSFFTDNSSIGYHPDRKKIIIVKDITSATSDCMLFSLDTGTWVYGDSNFTNMDNMSNFAINWNREAIFATDNGGGISLMKWDDDDAGESTKTIDIQTKDFDFGNNSSKNNVYKVIISYTGGGSFTNLTVSYATNGTGNWTAFTTKLDDTSTTQTMVEIEPDSIIQDIYSFQLKIAGVAHRDFKLNDIEVVYRNKRIH